MGRYTIEADESAVWIEARSSLHPIHSMTHGMGGYLEAAVGADGLLELSSAPRAHLELPIAEMSSGNGIYDREMMRRVEAGRFPTITATLRQMTPGESEGSYVAEGDVTFRGVTQRVSDEVRLSTPDSGTLVFEGRHVFNLRDFGMEPPRIMMLKVYPEVTIRVRIVAKEVG